jgi:hypothetical protein
VAIPMSGSMAGSSTGGSPRSGSSGPRAIASPFWQRATYADDDDDEPAIAPDDLWAPMGTPIPPATSRRLGASSCRVHGLWPTEQRPGCHLSSTASRGCCMMLPAGWWGKKTAVREYAPRRARSAAGSPATPATALPNARARPSRPRQPHFQAYWQQPQLDEGIASGVLAYSMCVVHSPLHGVESM